MMETRVLDAFKTNGSSPPKNYRVREVRFSVVRESSPNPANLSSPAAVADLIAALGENAIPDDAREHFVVLMLNAQNRLVAFHRASTGSLTASLVHPREVFGPALRTLGVASLILVHNHPSGDPTPSQEDTRLTRQLADAGRLLDIAVHDHLIIGNGTGRWVSFAERGLL